MLLTLLVGEGVVVEVLAGKLCCWDAGAVKVAVAPPAEACAGEDALVKVEDVEEVEEEEVEGEGEEEELLAMG